MASRRVNASKRVNLYLKTDLADNLTRLSKAAGETSGRIVEDAVELLLQIIELANEGPAARQQPVGQFVDNKWKRVAKSLAQNAEPDSRTQEGVLQ